MPVSPDTLEWFVPLSSISANALAEIAARAEERSYTAGSILFREGDSDTVLYFLLEGEVQRLESGGKNQMLNAGQDDARYALARTVPRIYTAKAMTSVRVICIEEDLLEHHLCCDQATAYEVFEYDGNDDPAWMWDVLTQAAFSKVPPTNINTMFKRFTAVPCKKDQVIIEQGAPGDYYYLIREGQASVKRDSSSGLKQALAEIGKGEGFGEEALLSGQPRNATVSMLTDGMLMRLSKQDFDELLSAPLIRMATAQTVSTLLKSGFQPLDVRLEDEFRAGTIRDSINLPLYLLRIKANALDKHKKYVLFCQNGQRSAIAGFLLTQRGFDVVVLDGGLNALPPRPAV